MFKYGFLFNLIDMPQHDIAQQFHVKAHHRFWWIFYAILQHHLVNMSLRHFSTNRHHTVGKIFNKSLSLIF